MGKQSRIRKYRKEFKQLASQVATEKASKIENIAHNMYGKVENPEHKQAIRWFCKTYETSTFKDGDFQFTETYRLNSVANINKKK